MKTPISITTTRASLVATAAYNTRWFASIVAGTTVLGSSALAVDNDWTGAVDNNWNNGANWSDPHSFGSNHVPQKDGGHPGDEDARINVLTNFPVITTATGTLPIPRDIKVGMGGGPGRLDIRSGSAATGGGNWMFVGAGGGGNGTFNLADTSTVAGGISGYALGSGGVTSERLYVGGIFGDGTGVANINTTGTHRVFNRVYVGANANSTGTVNLEAGTFIIGNDLALGSGGGTGHFNMTAGTVTCGGWNFYGKDEDGANGTGNFNMSGGSFTNTGRQYVGSGNTKGTFALSGGTYQNNGEFSVGSGNLANAAVSTFAVTGGTLNSGRISIGGEAFNDSPDGKATATVSGTATITTSELWIGQGGDSVGTFTMSGGTITTNGWVAVGREGADGTLNLSGGTFAKTGGGDMIVGSDASGSVGVVHQTGGTLSVNSVLNIGTAGGSTGTWTLDAGTATVGGTLYVADNGTGTVTLNAGNVTASGGVRVAQNGGSIATFALNGGTLTTTKISGGGGTDTTSFNGTQIVVGIPANPFMEGLDSATIAAGGLKVDTNGAVATSTQAFVGSGPVTKSGAGTLNLNGASTNTGTYSVTAGNLGIGTAATGSGAVTVSNGAGFGANQTAVDEVLNVPSVTLGTSTSLNINLGNFSGITASAPLNITTLNTVAGDIVINIADAAPEVGLVPLISYGTKTGTGNFTLGTLPLGVAATLDFSVPNLVQLNVTSAALPFWDGTVSNVWDTSTQNWINLIGSAPIAFANGNPALFDDFADGSGANPSGFTDVVLNSTVLPSAVTFENSTFAYTLTGSGSIGGSGGLLKAGTNTLLLSTANTYTGVTRLEGGVTTINSVANAGNASSFGSAASSVQLAGGSLTYDGTGAGSTDRGITIDAAGTVINTQDDLTIGGQVSTISGNLTKAGPANLTLSNASNQVGLAGQINRVDGTLTVSGTTSIPGELWVGPNPDVAGHLVVNGGSLNVGSWIALGRGNGESGTLSTLTGTNASIQCTNFSTGYNNNLPNDADQTVTLTNTVFTNNGATKLAESEQSTTNMTIGGTSSFTSAAEFLMALGENSICNVTVQDSGSLTKTGGWMSIGNSSNGVGTMTVKDNGTMTASGDLNVADVDTSTGTLNVQGNGLVVSTGTGGQGLLVGKNANTNGTVNLDGGTIEAMRVRGGAGTSTFNFNGGVLKARTGADGVFMDLINSAVVLPGGATINSNGQTIAIPQSLQDGGGGLNKTGDGTLLLNGGNTYAGTTTVVGGTLGGTGSIEGPLVVNSGAAVAPGANGIGTFIAGNTTITGKYVCEINSGSADQLAVIGSLSVSSGTLDIDAITPPTAPAYIIATYIGTPPAAFLSVQDLPSGYSVNYAYNDGVTSTNVAIVRPLNAYETWATGFGLDLDGNGASNSDPDGDGQSNSVEFALGGSPTSGTNNAKVFQLAADSSDGGSARELLMTIAVRSGTPAFGPLTGGLPTATKDGVTYTIQGSPDLAAFAGTVAVVATVAPPAPNATPPAGYEYRTFSLEGSDGLPGKGFLRVNVTP